MFLVTFREFYDRSWIDTERKVAITEEDAITAIEAHCAKSTTNRAIYEPISVIGTEVICDLPHKKKIIKDLVDQL